MLLFWGGIEVASAALRRRKEKSASPGDNPPPGEPVPKESNPARITNSMRSYFREEEVPIASLLGRDDPVIQDKVFTDCLIYGPAVTHFQACQITHSAMQVAASGNIDAHFMLAPQDYLVGPVLFLRCKFDRCKFRNISIVGTAQYIAVMRRHFEAGGFPAYSGEHEAGLNMAAFSGGNERRARTFQYAKYWRLLGDAINIELAKASMRAPPPSETEYNRIRTEWKIRFLPQIARAEEEMREVGVSNLPQLDDLAAWRDKLLSEAKSAERPS